MNRAQAGCSLMMRTMILAVEVAAVAQEGLFRVVMVFRAILEEPVMGVRWGPRGSLGSMVQPVKAREHSRTSTSV